MLKLVYFLNDKVFKICNVLVIQSNIFTFPKIFQTSKFVADIMQKKPLQKVKKVRRHMSLYSISVLGKLLAPFKSKEISII